MTRFNTVSAAHERLTRSAIRFGDLDSAETHLKNLCTSVKPDEIDLVIETVRDLVSDLNQARSRRPTEDPTIRAFAANGFDMSIAVMKVTQDGTEKLKLVNAFAVDAMEFIERGGKPPEVRGDEKHESFVPIERDAKIIDIGKRLRRKKPDDHGE